MKKAKINFLLTLFISLVFLNVAFAIDAEYKNSLNKIELSKDSESSYTLNLYTQKKFLDPVKVIRKNDLNYYILLPETKNSSARVNVENADIREVNTNAYSYPGQDVKNGYTKIEIKTTKPINFNVDVKNLQKQAKARMALPTKVATNTEYANSIVEKKNLAQKIQTTKPTLNAEQKSKLSGKTIVEKINNKKFKKIKADKKLANVQNKQEVQTVKPQKTKPAPVLEVDTLKTTNDTQQQAQQTAENKPEITQEVLEEFESAVNISDEQILKNLEEQENKENSLLKKILNLKSEIGNYLAENKTDVKLISILFVLTVIVFFIILFLLTRKPRSRTAKLRTKVELIDESVRATANKKAINGQYFVFDKNIVQTGLCKPTSSIKDGKAYELSNYNPNITPKNKNQKSDSEYDIIQKILHEDSTIDVSAREYDVIENNIEQQMKKPVVKKEDDELVLKNDAEYTSSPIKEEKDEIEQAEDSNAPKVYSKVEIAPEKGFMCVSFNDNISLVGYIYDDVFALHNFKCAALSNYEIKYRQLEADDINTDYIVKLGGEKMVVSVGKKSMSIKTVI